MLDVGTSLKRGIQFHFQPHGLLTMNALKENRFSFNIFGKTSLINSLPGRLPATFRVVSRPIDIATGAYTICSAN